MIITFYPLSFTRMVAESLPEIIDFDDVDFSEYEHGYDNEEWNNPSNGLGDDLHWLKPITDKGMVLNLMKNCS